LFKDACLEKAAKLHLQVRNGGAEQSYSPRLHIKRKSKDGFKQ
jgi:hypothetical protein